MTLEEFIIKWTGKGIDTDNMYGFQCMDLMHQYIMDCFGLPYSVLTATAAKWVWYNFSALNGNQYFDKYLNGPYDIPKKGDIMLWDGTYGHVAVLRDADLYHFNSFDQNYPVGSLPHIQYHSYTNVLGWLRFKGMPYTKDQALTDIKSSVYGTSDDSQTRQDVKNILTKIGM